MAWDNKDGLHVKFGVEEAKDSASGEFGAFDPGSVHLVEIELNPEVLNVVGKIYPSDTVDLPKTHYLKAAEIFVEETFVGTNMTLTAGYDNSDRTVFDADGIDVAVPVASLSAGATITCDGALVNTRVTTAKTPKQTFLPTLTVGTAVPTAGKGWLRLWYYNERI